VRDRFSAAGLDVLEAEPPSADNPLLNLENVVLTPHIAGCSDQLTEMFWRHSLQTL
jgi:D-3-phosphoglycerate dehydrogenase